MNVPVRRLFGLVLALAVLCAGPAAVAQATGPDLPGRPGSAHPCVSPSGRDLNQLFGVRDPIVAPFCPEVGAGERWRPVANWTTALDHAVIPQGYVPSRPAPYEDFAAKFVAARYVIDPGTRHERVHTLPAAQLLRNQQVVPADQVAFAAWVPAAAFRPLPAGEHVVAIHVTLSADHWDGFGTDPAFNRLPQGESFFVAHAFTVVPPGRR
jgi:hypothetical protein